jgi:hypothetical protein
MLNLPRTITPAPRRPWSARWRRRSTPECSRMPSMRRILERLQADFEEMQEEA